MKSKPKTFIMNDFQVD